MIDLIIAPVVVIGAKIDGINVITSEDAGFI